MVALLLLLGLGVYFMVPNPLRNEVASVPDVAPVTASDTTTQATPQTQAATAPAAPVIAQTDAAPAAVSEGGVPEKVEEEEVQIASDTEGDAVQNDTAEDIADADTAEDPGPEAGPAAILPSFDLVRVDPAGGAVIAGKAAPGAKVRLIADGEMLFETLADPGGKFVALFDLPPSATPRSLTIEADGEGGAVLASIGTVLIAPTLPVAVAEAETTEPATPDAQVAEPADVPADEVASDTKVEAAVRDEQLAAVSPEPQSDTPLSSTPVIVQSDGVALPTPNIDTQSAALDASLAPSPADPETAGFPRLAAPNTQPESPAIVLADEDGIRLLQPAAQPAAPVGDSPEVVTNLVIDTITYNSEGDVALGGRGAATSFARIYVNDRVIQTVPIEADGTWAAPLPEIDAGVYRLRIDEVTADGDVTSRVETPFQREEPKLAIQALQRPNAVTVQEGFTLWAIAEDRLGAGIEYVRVYEANRDLIRDPDLIYPGQVFAIPEG